VTLPATTRQRRGRLGSTACQTTAGALAVGTIDALEQNAALGDHAIAVTAGTGGPLGRFEEMSSYRQLFDVSMSPIDVCQRLQQDVVAAGGVAGVDMVVEASEGFMQAEQAQAELGNVFRQESLLVFLR
jgi:hypothetical protein